ncbi:conserved protein, unknown function [Hepatocystis sp. ex Piliocolobus tephrosceles]|nr:conserved protein, unknown function [Hepatocystis sp. ex Piliocolobus tephrosceles]
MKTSFLLFFIIELMIFYKTNAESKIYKLKLDNVIYSIFIEQKKVSFSDLDAYKIMFHSNHINYSGNAVIYYLYKLGFNNFENGEFLLKNINITYNAPLKYNDHYKIIGTITYYGNTSLGISLVGVTSTINEINNSRGPKSKIKNPHMKCKIKKFENKLTNMLSKYENTKHRIININDEGFMELSKQKKCKVFFAATFTLVQTDGLGQKQSISNNIKKKNLPMPIEKFYNLINIFC